MLDKYCICTCGKQISETQKFCPYCGSKRIKEHSKTELVKSLDINVVNSINMESFFYQFWGRE